MESIYAQADLLRVYKAILDSAEAIAKWLRNHTPKPSGTINAFGNEQTDADVLAEKLIYENLQKSGVVYAATSKESTQKKVLNKDGVYFVTFDPIDGSKLISANLSIASIFAIWRATDINGLTGRDLEGAALAIYSSRSSILLYNSHTKKVEELTLIKMGRKPKSWVVTKPSCDLNEYAHNFSPEGIKAAYEKPAYMKCFQKYVVEGYSIRYSSSMAMDCYQMFVKKGGIYTSIETIAHGAKLKLVYECIPIAFLVETSGGVATNGKESILDMKINGLMQKTQFIAGSKKEVEFVCQTLECGGSNVPDLEISARTRRASLGYIVEQTEEEEEKTS